MTKFTTSTTLILTLGLLAGAAYADEIIIPISRQGDYLGDTQRPTLGQSLAQVQTTFGEPIKKFAPTGSPPITRWDYVDFSVYFENNVVLHSVLKHRRLDELPATGSQ